MLTNCTISENRHGVICNGYSSPKLINCTISGNDQVGVYSWDSSPTLTSCIVWNNAGGSVTGGSVNNPGTGVPGITYSCIQGEPLWRGDGNINQDPLFCGWKGNEVWVDPSWTAPGDGSEGNPFSDPRQATTGFSLALSAGSPCSGTGRDGSDMGSDNGRCDGPAGTSRIVHLAPGTYSGMASCPIP